MGSLLMVLCQIMTVSGHDQHDLRRAWFSEFRSLRAGCLNPSLGKPSRKAEVLAEVVTDLELIV